VNPGRELSRTHAPDEAGAQERAWTVVRAAYADRASAPRRYRPWIATFPIALVLAGTLALTPAGAVVGHWIERTLGIRSHVVRLVSLPAPGQLLVSGPSGTWTLTSNGLRRRVGSWHQASWSPHGLYLAVATNTSLGAVTPDGVARWMLARPDVRDPEWYTPTGYRIAYLSLGDLRIVAGDGSGDHLLAADVAPLAPAWRPGHPYQIAYITRTGMVTVRDADSGIKLWSVNAPAGAFGLSWSAAGGSLLVLAPHETRVYTPSGRALRSVISPATSPIIDGALSPSGDLLALVRGGDSGALTLINIRQPHQPTQRLLGGTGLQQLQWSPDGRQLLVSWPAADQWIFIRIKGGPHITAISRIAQQFSQATNTHLPRLEGWCCTPQGTS
jgi:hypothetical protein